MIDENRQPGARIVYCSQALFSRKSGTQGLRLRLDGKGGGKRGFGVVLMLIAAFCPYMINRVHDTMCAGRLAHSLCRTPKNNPIGSFEAHYCCPGVCPSYVGGSSLLLVVSGEEGLSD